MVVGSDLDGLYACVYSLRLISNGEPLHGTLQLATTMEAQANTALKTFDLANQVQEIDPQDLIYRFDSEENKRVNKEALWKKE